MYERLFLETPIKKNLNIVVYTTCSSLLCKELHAVLTQMADILLRYKFYLYTMPVWKTDNSLYRNDTEVSVT